MPILNAANNTPFAATSKLRPTTEVPFASRPKYAFYFYAEGTFYDNFNFDNCREYIHFDQSIAYKEIDFSHQDMYYKRLYEFRRAQNGCKYYLCPWLVVPFEQQSGTYLAAMGPPPSNVKSLSLTVKPFSIFEQTISGKTKKHISQSARTLTLVSSGNGVNAVWDNPKSASTPAVIDEAACVNDQKITITIPDSASPYAYSSFLDIRVNPSDSVGRIYFVFLQIKRKKAIFLEFTEPVGANSNTNTVLDLKMLSVTESQSRVDALNKIFKLGGLLYADPGVSVEMKDQTMLNSGGSISLDIGEVIKPNSSAQTAVVTGKFTSAIAKIDNINWDANNSTYLLVCLMPYVKLVTVQFLANATATTTTTGNSPYASRTARIFVEAEKTLAHESAHGLGLPHWFHTKEDDLAQVGQLAESYAKLIGISSTQQLYLFHDAGHAAGVDVAFENQWTSSGTASLAAREKALRFLLFPRMYGLYLTDNLMDYQKNALPAHQKQLRKHQIEQMRYFA